MEKGGGGGRGGNRLWDFHRCVKFMCKIHYNINYTFNYAFCRFVYGSINFFNNKFYWLFRSPPAGQRGAFAVTLGSHSSSSHCIIAWFGSTERASLILSSVLCCSSVSEEEEGDGFDPPSPHSPSVSLFMKLVIFVQFYFLLLSVCVHEERGKEKLRCNFFPFHVQDIGRGESRKQTMYAKATKC